MATSTLGELFRRKIPQYLGIYFAAGWGALEFTDFLVNRYVLSPHLTDFVLLAWALLIPTVLMLAWFHGAPGPDRWTKVEKFGIPANLAAGAAVLLLAFAGKDLGAATKSVTLEDETGRTIERVIPKREFRKSLASYYFDNVSGDTALDWLQYGVPWALAYDLEQDLFLDVRSADGLLPRLREEGFADGLRVALPLKQQLANGLHLGFFVAGEISREGDQRLVTTYLYETRTGKLLQTRAFSGNDVFALVDQMSSQLKRDLEIPAQHIEESKDLPVSEILTSSEDAFRDFVDGYRAMLVENDYDRAVRYLESTVNRDPQFALAHLQLFSAYLNQNEVEKSQLAMQTAMGLLYKMPERTQLQAKAIYYWLIKQDLDRALIAAGMQAELFPHDIQAQETLAQLHSLRSDEKRAVAAWLRVFELDPARVDALLAIGRLYESEGEFDLALDYYRRHAAAAPTHPISFLALGDLYKLLGEHEPAREQYEKALATDPRNVAAMVGLAALEVDLGNFERASAAYDDALAASVTAEQRARVYRALRDYYVLRGQPGRAVDYQHRYWAELTAYESPFLVLQNKLQSLDTYLEAGMVGAVRDTLESIAAQLSPPFDVLLPLGQVGLYIELEDADSIEVAVEGVERFVEAFGLEDVRADAIYAGGRALEIRGDCREAIVSYERALGLAPGATKTNEDIGRCYRKLGQPAEAVASIERALAVRPSNPRFHYEIALAYADMGDHDKAVQHLETAMSVWEDAEPGYERAGKARNKLAELTGGENAYAN